MYDPFVSKDVVEENNCKVVDKIEGLKIADYISIHLPLNVETKNFIGEQELLLMKETAIVVNTARGGIINEVKGKSYIAHCQNTKKVAIEGLGFKDKHISIFIGPEGDFTHEEIQAAADANVNALTLGEKRFRTETAGIIACHSISLLYQ